MPTLIWAEWRAWWGSGTFRTFEVKWKSGCSGDALKVCLGVIMRALSSIYAINLETAFINSRLYLS